MKILYFSNCYTGHDHRFVSELSDSGHDVWFLSLTDGGPASSGVPTDDRVHQVAWPAAEIRGGSRKSPLQLMPAFQVILEDVRPDLVHAGPVQSCGFMTALSRFHPFLVMSWGWDLLVEADRDELSRWITHFTLSSSDMLLCDCNAVRTAVQQVVSYPEDRIVQLPWGVDLHQFSPGVDTLAFKRQPGWEDSVVVLATRSWEPIYGINVLLESFHQAYTQDSRLRLILLGDGSLGPRIRALIAEYDLGDVVVCPGIVPHEQLPNYFRSADIYLSCASCDGTSVSLLEAMATGLPAIVTDIPSNREWVVSEENGWLAPTGDAKVFADCLVRAAHAGPGKRKAIAQKNRDIAETRADWHANFKSLLKAYDGIRSIQVC